MRKTPFRQFQSAHQSAEIGVDTITAPAVPPSTINAAVNWVTVLYPSALDQQPTEDAAERNEKPGDGREVGLEPKAFTFFPV